VVISKVLTKLYLVIIYQVDNMLVTALDFAKLLMLIGLMGKVVILVLDLAEWLMAIVLKEQPACN